VWLCLERDSGIGDCENVLSAVSFSNPDLQSLEAGYFYRRTTIINGEIDGHSEEKLTLHFSSYILYFSLP